MDVNGINQTELSLKKETMPLKVILSGDAGVGKTSFVKYIKTVPFETKYVGTVGYEAHPHTYNDVTIMMYDMAGDARRMSNDITINALCADAGVIILMYDVTHKTSYLSLKKWYDYYRNINSTVPIVVVGNKIDSEGRRMNATNTTFHIENTLPHFELSAKTGQNVSDLLNHIATHY